MMRRNYELLRAFLLVLCAFAGGGVAPALAAECRALEHLGQAYSVCRVDPATEDIRLFLNGPSGAPFGNFSPIADLLAANGETLVMAMNGGMYHRDRTPVGLYVERGETLKRISTRPGPGNFHMLPNGVFYIGKEGGRRGAGVVTTDEYLDRAAKAEIDFATQSGPMLVIEGALHPRFIPGSDSRKRRNGVGQQADGSLVFAISDGVVNLHDFATLFRDALKAPNALYLDGTISRFYAPALERHDFGVPMGPIIGVVQSD